MDSPRGLVVSCPIQISNGRLHCKCSDLDPQELRFSLLFWDKLDYPTNNIIAIGLSPDAEYLVDAGILKRTEIRFAGTDDMVEAFRLAHIRAFEILDSAEKGVWSLATGENSIAFSDSELDQGRGALVSLHRAIPVPDQDVPLTDVLEFRAKRRPELLSLRHHLEEIYERVCNAGDGELVLRSQIEALERAVVDYINSTRGFGITWRGASLLASLNVAAGLLAGEASIQSNLSSTAAAWNIAGAMFTLTTSAALSARAPSATPYKYVSRYHDEIFRPG